jgi:hypothetical protein
MVYLQIVHLKRFQFVNGKWVKSQKVVNFPFNDFDPTAYLASVPKHTVVRHRELERLRLEGGEADLIQSTSPPLNGGHEAIIAPDNSEAIRVDNEKIEADLSSPRKHLGLIMWHIAYSGVCSQSSYINISSVHCLLSEFSDVENLAFAVVKLCCTLAMPITYHGTDREQ